MSLNRQPLHAHAPHARPLAVGRCGTLCAAGWPQHTSPRVSAIFNTFCACVAYDVPPLLLAKMAVSATEWPQALQVLQTLLDGRLCNGLLSVDDAAGLARDAERTAQLIDGLPE